MPQPKKITRAFLQEIGWDDEGQVNRQGDKVDVQFNPETLKVSFSNQMSGGDQAGGSAIQFSSKGKTKLSFDLWFDVTAPSPDNASVDDVRALTKKIADFMQTERRQEGENVTYVPPGVRFQWGSFLFEGVMESINETMEFFSEEGKPLRASVSVGLIKQDVEVRFAAEPRQADGSERPGTEPLTAVRSGDSLQDLSSRQGNPERWQEKGLANGIENPRRIPAGMLLNLKKPELKLETPGLDLKTPELKLKVRI